MRERSTHLGDVSDGVTPGQGDNVVNAADASLLRAAEAQLRELGECRLDEGKTILAVVGHELPRKAGAGAQILATRNGWTQVAVDGWLHVSVLGPKRDSFPLSVSSPNGALMRAAADRKAQRPGLVMAAIYRQLLLEIQRELETPIAKGILAGQFIAGHTIAVDVEHERLRFAQLDPDQLPVIAAEEPVGRV